ncbi:ComF family protein [Streptomyces sp. NPDC006172]|uniref:ComF family protein n=1 Tax=Streptomyces sp. NPDC006172 TaxID=3154470 RepID=UPI0033DCA6DA
MDSVRRWWQELASLILPAECAGCGRARVMLCPACRTALSGAGPRRVRPEPEPPGLPAVHAAARYADEVRAVLLAHKERGALALARPLGEALAGAVRVGLGEVGVGEGAPPQGQAGNAAHAGHVLLVPVPSAPHAVRARGHDPARRIALAAAVLLRREGMPVRVAAVLRQRRAVADQAGLNSRQRMENLDGALAVVPGGARLLRGGSVVLVDDLVTTGASLAEAARTVRAAVAGGTPDHEGPTRGESGQGGAPVCGGAAGQGRDEAPRAGGASAGVAEDGTAGGSVRGRGTTDDGCAGGRAVGVAVRDGFWGGAVHRDVGREGSGVRGVGVREGGGGRGGGELLFAAVVAASPDSPEINRN